MHGGPEKTFSDSEADEYRVQHLVHYCTLLFHQPWGLKVSLSFGSELLLSYVLKFSQVLFGIHFKAHVFCLSFVLSVSSC